MIDGGALNVVEQFDVPDAGGIVGGSGIIGRGRVGFLVVGNVNHEADSELASVGEAADALGFAFRASEGGKQKAGVDRDDRDGHQQLDEGECRPLYLCFHFAPLKSLI